MTKARASTRQDPPNSEQHSTARQAGEQLSASATRRRQLLSFGALFALGACAEDETPPDNIATGVRMNGRQIMLHQRTVDMHSHAGRLIPTRTDADPTLADERPFEPLAAPMHAGGLAVVCLAVVADTPVTHVVDGRIEAMREPAPGELYRWAQMAFDRAHRLIDSQGMGTVTDMVSLRSSNWDFPCAIVAAEGADFLEGQIDRVDEFYQRKDLRHLQLVHYRVNQLGDIQTAPEQHGGLTDFGAQVIRRCNQVGLVVDVAHGPYSLVKRAADVTSKPLVLSHTALAALPQPRSRLISPDHARVVAGTGGVIGIWPSTGEFADLHALAEGMARMVDVVGVDHVGFGSDMQGLTRPSVLSSYADMPLLADQMLAVGFQPIDVGKILGGNYLRVYRASIVPR